MLLILAFALAVAVALARGGRLSRLAAFPLRAYGLALLALALQAASIYWLPEDSPTSLRVALLAVSYAILVCFVWLNRRLPGVWLVGLGLAANWLVMLANGGHMPVTYEALAAAGRAYLAPSSASGTLVAASKDVILPLAETQLWFLSDIFVLPPPFPVPGVFSPGDVLIAVGTFILVQSALDARSLFPGRPAQSGTA